MSLRVDFHTRYSRPQSPPSGNFPEQPILEVVLVNGRKHFIAFGLLDTGSTWTVIGTKYAAALGLDYKTARQETIIGLGGAASIGYEVDLKFVLRVANYPWTARVLVSTAVDPFPFILLGHQGFFDTFDATFQTRHRHFHITKASS